MKLGVILPTFRADDSMAIEVARQAERFGIDGVFAYDHIWPMGRPDRPSLAPFPVLAKVASLFHNLTVGTLVARVGLVSKDVLVAEALTMNQISSGRFIFGLGTGDKLSRQENDAYKIPYGNKEQRRSELYEIANAVRKCDIPVWLSGIANISFAKEHNMATNLWNVDPEEIVDNTECELTWAGPMQNTSLDEQPVPFQIFIEGLRNKGMTWAVFSWPVTLEKLARFRSVG